jgi:ketosteroid isomerase-like protein
MAQDLLPVVTALEDRRYQAMLDADLAVLEELCHPELTYTHSNAERDTRDSYLKKVADGYFRYHRIEHPIERIVLVGDTALVLGAMRADVETDGVPKRLDNSCLAVWVRDGGRWQLLAYQPTVFPK